MTGVQGEEVHSALGCVDIVPTRTGSSAGVFPPPCSLACLFHMVEVGCP